MEREYIFQQRHHCYRLLICIFIIVVYKTLHVAWHEQSSERRKRILTMLFNVRFHVYDFRSGSLPQRRQHSPPAEKSDLMLRNQRFWESMEVSRRYHC